MILDHAFNIQTFKHYQTVQGHKRVTKLMSKVAASVGNPLVNASGCFALFTSLRFSQRFLIPKKKARVSNLLTRRERGEVRQANVNPDVLFTEGKRLWLDFNREARIPLACRRAGDAQRLNLTFQRAVQLDSHIADFRQAQLVAFEREAGLSVGETVVTLPRSESWESCFLFRLHATKETVKRLLYPLENILQYLRVNARNIWANLFDVGQLVRLCNVAHRLMLKAIGITAFLQTRVVEFAAQVKRRFKFRHLSMRRIDAVFICFAPYYSFVSHREPRERRVLLW